MKNLMVVRVKYTNSGMTLTTDRFTYERYDGSKMTDSVRLSSDYTYDSKVEQAADWLKTERGMNVIGKDTWGQKEGFVIVEAIDHSFKSISGKHEKSMENK